MNRSGRPETVHLFAYGTLQIPDVMRAVTGRTFPGRPAILEGYRRGHLGKKSYPGIVRDPGFRTEGMLLLDLGPEILMRLDRFEGEAYRRERVEVVTGSGGRMPACTYVIPPESRDLPGEPWDLERFRREDLGEFLRGYAGFKE